ncbi:hypothetical protein BC939DRAFT_451169 [Gamsiella multidivaricata]|uniref:uncharacterized protein n=1 Tax=Gamsiella multidivaricata TaxID=101098 RepID=UPI00221FA253|nr:uncharacterized protein BC939DRAFT_451169 [Gamsiella multidivaricata]KAI7823896.1 hypothetical protein BC939DRAFT_451169 [Gamsiella multidivaricata]
MVFFIRAIKKSHFSLKASAQKQEQLSRPSQPKRAQVHKHTPLLEIPEILESIISFLDSSTRKNTRLVCKQWYAVSRPFFCIHTVWQENPVPQEQHYVLQCLANIDALAYTVEWRDYDDTPNVRIAWNRLRDQVQCGKAIQLRTLELNGPVNAYERIQPLLPFMVSLSTLKLQFVNPEDYTIAMFLKGCPQLRKLSIHSRPPLRAVRTPVVQAGDLGESYGLRSLELILTCIAQDALVLVVASCPNLRSLVLTKITEPQLPPNDSGTSTRPLQRVRVDNRTLLAHIAGLCPRLHHLHYSATQGHRDMIASLTNFRNLDSLGVSAQTVCLQTVSIIRNYSNSLTSLTIEGVAANPVELSQSLHRYLCASPQLKHLDAPDIGFNDRLLNLGNNYSNLDSEQIWACRNLLSLRISFDFALGEPNGSISGCSRVLYGYISQVCPQLENLSIFRHYIDCSIDGGLCLLGELEGLKMLEIKTTSLEALHLWDFSWMNNEPTIIQRIMNRMSSNDSRLQRSLRSRYEWLGYDDCRAMDKSKLQKLGLLVRADFSAKPRHHRRSSSGSSSSSSHGGRDGSKVSAMNSRIRWPLLERFVISQRTDRRGQAQTVQDYLRKMRPGVECIVE